MLQSEFEARVGRRVSTEDYVNIIEPLYTRSDLNKDAFCKAIKPIIKAMPDEQKRLEKVMLIHNAYGDCKTPNGCWYMTVRAVVKDINISTGIITVEEIPNSFELRYDYDIDEWSHNIKVHTWREAEGLLH